MSGELATLRIMVMVLSGGTFHLKRPNIWYSKLSKEGRSRTVSILLRREAQGLLESGTTILPEQGNPTVKNPTNKSAWLCVFAACTSGSERCEALVR
jgi:hypothetical protein